MKTSESENNFQCVNDDHVENKISKERFSTWHAKSVSCEQTIVFYYFTNSTKQTFIFY